MGNIQTLLVEIYKVANDVSPEIKKELVNFREGIGYGLR